MSFHSLCHDPTWLQHVKRLGYRIVHQPRLLAMRLRRWRHALRATWQRSPRQAVAQPIEDAQIPPLVSQLFALGAGLPTAPKPATSVTKGLPSAAPSTPGERVVTTPLVSATDPHSGHTRPKSRVA